MKKLILALSIILTGLTVYSQGHWRPGEMEVKVVIDSPDEALNLARLQLNGDIYTSGGYALLYLTPDELKALQSAGFTYEVLKTDLNEFYKDFWENRDEYHSYEDIIQVMNTLSFGYPSICKKYDFGLSLEGRLLSALKISDNAAIDENEPEVMFDGGIHGDEIGGPENLIRFAQHLCSSYGVDPDITGLIDTREIWLYIMVNPDGRVNMVRYNANGVDLNRDWGYMWNGEGGSTGYYSQVETRTLRDCMYDNQFVVHTTYHSGTEFLSYPWSYRPDPCPDQAHIDYLATVYVNESGYSNLPYGQGYSGMYAINGSSKDAYYAIMGSVGWTIEISMDKQPPTSQIQYYYEINLPAMLAAIEYAGFGISGTVTDAITGQPVRAMIFIDDYYPSYTDPAVGDYHKYLTGGTYEVTAVANGYEPQTQTVNVAGNTATSIADFALQPAYNHFAYRVSACQIPDNNYDDEGTTFAALGEPDGVRYSIGRSGWIILDMGETVLDGPGSEIRVYEGDNDPEGYSCYAGTTQDGPWIYLGTGTGTTSFNFTPSGLMEARFIRIIDDGNGSASGDNAGFDLDAVETLEQPPVIYLVVDAAIEDPLGNGNNRLDPGENCDLVVTLRNHGGLTAENVTANLNFDSTYVAIPYPDTIAGNLAHGEIIQLSFALSCDPETPLEEIVMMVLNITASEGEFRQSYPMHFTVGAIIEDWETGGFEKFEWSATGTMPWAINFIDPYQGQYAAKSANIDDGQSSGLEVTFDVVGYDDISFYRKVSSEAGMDFLNFYIDDNLVDRWSGSLPWAPVSYDVTPGTHTFRWSYDKNGEISHGIDGAWLDYIVFPSSNLTGDLHVIANASPHRFCGTGESQLGAYVIGGSGSYDFSWAPAATLSNPAIQFPLANPLATTIYTVTADDGQTSLTSDILVTIDPIPEKPAVTQQGDSLISSATQGNQWYDSNGPIEGATGQVYYPPAEDYYHVMVTSSEGCVSEASDPLYFIFTDLDEASEEACCTIYPNPFSDRINIHLPGQGMEEGSLILTDITGRRVYYMEFRDSKQLTISLAGLAKGIYTLYIVSQENEILVIEKMIK